MHASASLLLTSCALLLAGTIISAGAGNRKANTLLGVLFFLSCLLVIVAAMLSWASPAQFTAPYPLYLGVAPLAFTFDRLACVFALLLAVVGASTALFSPGYLSCLRGHINERMYWACMNIFFGSMLLVILSANAVTFLLFWEVMSLSSAALLSVETSSKKARKAALIYLGATRIATALLAGGFLWMHAISSSWSFSDWHVNASLFPALLIGIGLCVKAGIWPFHIWLPYAHPTAPSPASALMSGVMIKVALYAMVRLFIMDGTGCLTIAFLFLLLGMVSAVWGVLFATVQHDLKRLLAYSSVENVGLILMGIALCIYAQALKQPQIAVIGLVAAIFHSVNHGIFKSLLFLGAGTVDAKAHTRDMNFLGGLSRKLPWTMACFLIGSCAVCALPPLNGFAGKWLIYQALFNIACQSQNKFVCGFALACIGTLALVGGLSLACFSKAFSVTFLGRPRSNLSEHTSEGSPPMVLSQIVLVSLCVLLGLASAPITCLLSTILPGAMPWIAAPSLDLFSLALMLAALVSLLYLLVFFGKRKTQRQYMTWDCGYGHLASRMQVTSESFSHSIARLFSPVLQYATKSQIAGKDRRHFPEAIEAEPIMVSLLESRVYGPLVTRVRSASEHFSKLQAGSIHLYLLYVFVTLVVLLAVGGRS